MATLSTLKLTAAVKPTSVPAVQLRRNKLVLRLWEQCELARAQAVGTVFAPLKFRSVERRKTLFTRTLTNCRVKRHLLSTPTHKHGLHA